MEVPLNGPYMQTLPRAKIKSPTVADPGRNGNGVVRSGSISSLELCKFSEEERVQLLDVLKRDLEVRAMERNRLMKIRMELLNEDRRISMSPNPSFCAICSSRLVVVFNPGRQCNLCRRTVCRRCSNHFHTINDILCSLCIRETFYKAMVGQWFYEKAPNKFTDYASNNIVKKIFRDKIPAVQCVTEGQLHQIVSAYLGPSRTTIINDQLVTPEIMKKVEAEQIRTFHRQYRAVKASAVAKLRAIGASSDLTDFQVDTQTDEVTNEFIQQSRAALMQLLQMLCITVEKYNFSLGLDGNQTSNQVLKIAEAEVGRIVGRRVKVPNEYIFEPDDNELETLLESVTGSPEQFLAHVLLEDLTAAMMNEAKKRNGTGSELMSAMVNGGEKRNGTWSELMNGEEKRSATGSEVR